MEAHFETEKGAAFVIGGIPDEEKEEIKYAVKIPKVLSFLVSNDFNAEVKGLKDFPKDEWPPIAVTHYAFQIMIFFGVVMICIGAVYLYSFFFKKEWLTKNWLLKTFLLQLLSDI
jgi:cytochrome d ubiquinol oxidase subunit I